MDDTFQVLMPLEGVVSVPSVISHGGVSSVGGDDFLQVLMQQMQANFALPYQDGMPMPFPFQMDGLETQEIPLEGKGNVVEQEAGLLSQPFPLPVFCGDESMLFSDFSAGAFLDGIDLLKENALLNEGTATTVENVLPVDFAAIFETLFPQGEEPLSLEEQTGSENGNKVFFYNGFESLFTSEESTVVSSNQEIENAFMSVSGPNSETQVLNDQQFGSAVPENNISSDNLFTNLEMRDLTFKEIVNLRGGEDFIMPEVSQEKIENIVLEAQLEAQYEPTVDMMVAVQERDAGFKMEAEFLESMSHQVERSAQETTLERVDPEAGFFSERNNDTAFGSFVEGSMADDLSERQENETFSESLQDAGKATFGSEQTARIDQIKEIQSIAQQIIKSARFSQNSEVSEFRISLEPEYLGSLKMSIVMENDAMFAKIITDNAYTRDILTNDLNVLKESLERVGIKLDVVEVVTEEEEHAFTSTESDAKESEQNTYGSESKESTGFEEFLKGYEEKEVPASVISEVADEMYHVDYLI